MTLAIHCDVCGKTFDEGRWTSVADPEKGSLWYCERCYAKHAAEVREQQTRPKYVDPPSRLAWWKKV